MSLFITFEGPDGSGKSTQLERLAEYLRGRGYSVFCTREPGGSAIGDQIREVLLNVANQEMVDRAEILLYSASRAQLVHQVILPHLAQGDIVLCDRYADSTYAYQGYGRQLDLETLRKITHFATGGLKPDLTIYLDLEVAEGLRRKEAASAAGQGDFDRLDGQQLTFHERVRQGYLALREAEPERWLAIEANRPVEVISRDICRRLEPLLPLS